MADSKLPPKGDKVTVTETKDVTGKELLGTSPVGGPPDVTKQDAAARLAGVDDPAAVRTRGPVDVDPKPFDINNVQGSGTGTFVDPKSTYTDPTGKSRTYPPTSLQSAADSYPSQNVKGGQFQGGELNTGDFSTREALLHNDLNATSSGGNPTVNEASNAVATEDFLQLLDLDGRWAVRCQGKTVFLEPKSDFTGLPVPGMLQKVFSHLNHAITGDANASSTRADSPTIARADAARKSELDVALSKKALEDRGVGT